ncbi:MAG: M48 family metalloprotease [Phycisphaerales bacterium]|nr:M48 family metalloprotease [Phycisphaerales bacterium]
MYFIVIMAFALVLSDKLPVETALILRADDAATRWITIGIVLLQIPIMALLAGIGAARTQYRLNGTAEGQDDAADELSWFQQIELFVIAAMLVFVMVCTAWPTIVRMTWHLDAYPLAAEAVMLAPTGIALLAGWAMQYRAELRLRLEALELPPDERGVEERRSKQSEGVAAIQASLRRPDSRATGIVAYLVDKVRHHILFLAIPMCIIVVAKHLIDRYSDADATWLIKLPRDQTARMLILQTALGTVSFIVLALAPVMLRYIWATEPLPDGPLRKRFERTCERIGLRYREILLWHTHGMAVNAAVMGFVAPLRYIMVSDALLETMDDEEIEAVFGHEAGHVRHWHLPFFGVFAIVSMYVAGGATILATMFYQWKNWPVDPGALQLVGLVSLLGMWLFGFSWLSRKFERQADLYGVRCVTPDIKSCTQRCPVHGEQRRAGLCVTAVHLFGNTLGRIADLNGIPREAPSWRHGSIQSRCELLEQFAGDAEALAGFDRYVFGIKWALMICGLIGTIVAAWLYYDPLMRLFGLR